MTKIIAVILGIVVMGFVWTNFFWRRPIPYGLASSSSGLGLPWAYERQICGDVLTGGRFECRDFTEPERLTWNGLAWAVVGFAITGVFYLGNRKQKKI